MAPLIRLGLIDDHPVVVSGFRAAFAALEGIELVAVGGTIEDARAMLQRDDLDVVLLDVRLADGNGIQALAELGTAPHPAVLAMSAHGSAQYVAAARQFGAAGLVMKGVPLPALVEAVRTVAEGGTVFTPDQLSFRYVNLSQREREVLRLAMDGLSNKEIGARLGTSRKTVEAHLSDIYTRYGITGGRVELSIRAAEEGWLEIKGPGRTPRARGEPPRRS